MRVTDDDGIEYEIDQAVLNGGSEEEDPRVELERIRSENARQAETIRRLASKPGMSIEDGPSPSEVGSEAFKAARAKNLPEDEAMRAYVEGVAQTTMSRAEAKAEALKVAENFDKLLADVEAMKTQIQG